MERIDPTLLAPATASRPRALVVDDDAVARIALRKLLADCGYDTALARNGAEGIEQFRARRPDIVFMDMQMPVMDGLDATLQIKALCADMFVPVIFVTGNSSDEELERCIDAGGDDFLVKPYNRKAVAAKIRAMERIGALHRRSDALRARMEAELALAKSILEGAVMGSNVRPAPLGVYLMPATTFNGDLLLSAYAPSGDLHVLLGDFTGHGLAATVGALPVAETFRAMTGKGFGPARILAEINTKLRAILPTGLFLAVAFIQVDRSLTRATLINCGMPEAWLFNEHVVKARFPSTSFPLAVVDGHRYEADEVVLQVSPGDRLMLVSDGAIEAGDADGLMLGSELLRLAIEAGLQIGQSPIASAILAIDGFCDGTAHADDVSLVDIHLVEALFPALNSKTELFQVVPGPGNPGTPDNDTDTGWKLALELRGHALREISPIPVLMSLLKEFPGTAQQSARLFTVLSELYNNALDHGVLGLDSSLKGSDFSAYLDARDLRLATPDGHHVTVQIDCRYGAGAGQMDISVQDSGAGFDPAGITTPGDDAPHGRGLLLVRRLCKSLAFDQLGKRARALYAWRAVPAPAQLNRAPAD